MSEPQQTIECPHCDGTGEIPDPDAPLLCDNCGSDIEGHHTLRGDADLCSRRCVLQWEYAESLKVAA